MTSRRLRLALRRLVPARRRDLAAGERFDARRPTTAYVPRAILELAVGGRIDVEQLADVDLRCLAAPLTEELRTLAEARLSGHDLLQPCRDTNVNRNTVDGRARRR